jgi:hypothetical protein
MSMRDTGGENYWRAAENVMRAGQAALQRNPIDAALYASKALLDLVTPDVAHQLLTEEAVRRQNAIADIAEIAKFHGDPFGKE